MRRLTSLEVCAGGGGQAIGLEEAGFDPVMLFDNDPHACATLRANRPGWDVRQLDLLDFVGHDHPRVLDVDLLACGPPRLPYSIAAKRRSNDDRHDLLRAAIWLATEVRPRAILIENVPALIKDSRFADTREFISKELTNIGYSHTCSIVDAQDYGVPQRREHGVIVAMHAEDFERFEWPRPTGNASTVGDVLWTSMASRGWTGAAAWRLLADEVAPTIVGGSKDRGGADLGPSRTKNIWARLAVNGSSLANEVPASDFVMDLGDRRSLPKLTISQVAMLQGFSDGWHFAGGKTAAYRQVGHAFPPPLAAAIGDKIARVLRVTEA